jgi:hypothetical protein
MLNTGHPCSALSCVDTVAKFALELPTELGWAGLVLTENAGIMVGSTAVIATSDAANQQIGVFRVSGKDTSLVLETPAGSPFTIMEVRFNSCCTIYGFSSAISGFSGLFAGDELVRAHCGSACRPIAKPLTHAPLLEVLQTYASPPQGGIRTSSCPMYSCAVK